MNIVWNVETVIQADGTTKGIKIARLDVWKRVKLSEPILNGLRGVHTVDITKNNQIFNNIPVEWYMVEN